MSHPKPPAEASRDVSAFLDKVAATPARRQAGRTGRLMFAMDATASREPTWDRACHLQGEMFSATDSLGGLSVQLCYYRGFNEFRALDWCSDTAVLLRQMSAVRCLGGQTQIGRVLKHALRAHHDSSLQAVVFVGDAMEENPDTLCDLAGQLGLQNIPAFMFQEGTLPLVRSTFQQMAQLSGGAWAPFDLNSAHQLKELLAAVAVFAAGGRSALEDLSSRSSDAVKRITRQLKP
ncbi:MAG: VWA domain-containing protein [Proteobacteria bacterium]|nr:VWA domain-containing protein [Pseudomonadota bacterium]